jgi:hypothetical protein
MRKTPILVMLLLVCVPLFAQAPTATNADAAKRADSYLSKMSVQEKIDYIGGIGFAVRPVPALGLPPLQMSDGPFGVRSNETKGFRRPPMRLASVWPRLGTPTLPKRSERESERMRGPAAFILCWARE